jgi:hypothetical protein
LSQNDLDWLAARLSIAVYDVNRISPEMSVLELKAALSDIPGADSMTIGYAPNGNQLITVDGKTVEVGPMASNDEIRLALQNPFIRTENTKIMTIADQLKAARAQLAEARQGASNAVAESADASRVVLQEAQKVLKEAADLRAEVAELTNGGPA